jgi:hypothetical protein
MIRVVHPGSGSSFFTHPWFRIPDLGSGSATLLTDCTVYKQTSFPHRDWAGSRPIYHRQVTQSVWCIKIWPGTGGILDPCKSFLNSGYWEYVPKYFDASIWYTIAGFVLDVHYCVDIVPRNRNHKATVWKVCFSTDGTGIFVNLFVILSFSVKYVKPKFSERCVYKGTHRFTPCSGPTPLLILF